MARSPSISATFLASGAQQLVLPMSISAPWSDWVLQDLSTIDAATITNPEAQITAATRRTWLRRFAGTSIQLQGVYPRGATSKTTDPQLVVAGRSIVDGIAQGWNLLTNDADDSVITIELDPTNDADDGSVYKYSTVKSTNWLDCQGYDEFVCGLARAGVLNVSVATGFIRARFI